MGLFSRKPKVRNEAPRGARKPPVERDAAPRRHAHRAADDDEVLLCTGCGRALGFDPEDEPNGDGQNRHLCGECNRARNFDAEVEMMWHNGDL